MTTTEATEAARQAEIDEARAKLAEAHRAGEEAKEVLTRHTWVCERCRRAGARDVTITELMRRAHERWHEYHGTRKVEK